MHGGESGERAERGRRLRGQALRGVVGGRLVEFGDAATAHDGCRMRGGLQRERYLLRGRRKTAWRSKES